MPRTLQDLRVINLVLQSPLMVVAEACSAVIRTIGLVQPQHWLWWGMTTGGSK